MTRSLAQAEIRTRTTLIGAMLIRRGDADAMLCGSDGPYAGHLRYVRRTIGLRAGVCCFAAMQLLILPQRQLFICDTHVNPDPTAEQLAHIAVSSADTALSFGVEPLVAMLSYSTGESGKGADVDKVKEATRIARKLRPDLKLEGPIQYDAAIDPDVARGKLPNSEVAGHATVR